MLYAWSETGDHDHANERMDGWDPSLPSYASITGKGLDCVMMADVGIVYRITHSNFFSVP